MFKRFLSVILFAGVLMGMSIPSGAVDASGTATVTIYRCNSSGTPLASSSADISFPRAATSTSVYEDISMNRIGLEAINVPPTQVLNVSGAVGIYFSYYVLGSSKPALKTPIYYGVANSSEYSSVLTNASNWAFRVYDANGEDAPVSSDISVTSFSPSTDLNCTPGITVSCKFTVDSPITGFVLEPLRLIGFWPNGNVGGSGNPAYFKMPSFSVIATETSADLTALEGIADEIAAGNALAAEMYADIMAALNAISGDTTMIAGYMKDALTALNSINTHTSNIYTLCSTYFQYLVDISRTASSIDTELKAYHEDFMSMMETLQGTIMDESDDIQAKMEEIYNLLIAYLDSQYASAVNPDLIESTGNAQLDIDRQEELEVGFQSNLTESWTDLKLETFALGGGYTSAVAWVSSWFSNFYNAMGDYGMILLLPLYIGIVTLVAGLARQAIRRSGRSDRSRGGKKDA